MTGSKLTVVLKSFDKNQFKRFGKFVSSPFFNTNPTIIKFYNIIRKYHPDFDEKQVDKQKVFSRLYPGSPYRDSVMRNLISDMMVLAHEFIVQMSVSKNSFDKELYQLVYFNQLKLDDQFEKKMLKLEVQFSDCPVNEEEYFTNLKLLEREKQLFYSIRNRQELGQAAGFKENYYALYSFLLTLFRTSHNTINYKNNYYDSSLFKLTSELISKFDIDKLICLFKEKNFEHSEIIELYYLNYLAVTNHENDEYFNRFRRSFEKNYLRFSEYALYNLIIAIENCCTFKIQMGKYEYIREYVLFQKWLDSKGIESTPAKYYHNSVRFLNMVIYGCYLKDIDWLEQYIKKYSSRLNPEYRKSIHKLSYAYINFEKCDYDRSLNLLAGVNYDHISLKLYVRELSLFIYYETGNFESAYLMLDSFHHFLSTNKSESEMSRKKYLNFLKIYKELLDLKAGNSKKIIKHLKSEIIDNTQAFRPRCMAWLLEKIGEMENQ